MIQTTAVLGTAHEIIEYLQANGNGSRYWLTQEPPSEWLALANADPPLSIEEEEKLFDELALIGEGRTDPSLRYDREDIYFDR